MRFRLRSPPPPQLLNWGPIWYLVAAVPFMLWLDRSGIRGATLAGIGLVLFAHIDKLMRFVVVAHAFEVLNGNLFHGKNSWMAY